MKITILLHITKMFRALPTWVYGRELALLLLANKMITIMEAELNG